MITAPTHRKAIITDHDRHPITEVILERAVTWKQQQIGLMHRTQLGENEGMVFIAEWEDYYEVWMKDTPLSLDIIFLDRMAQIITIHHSAMPNNAELRYNPVKPAKFIIELNGGFCKKYKIDVGYYILPVIDE